MQRWNMWRVVALLLPALSAAACANAAGNDPAQAVEPPSEPAGTRYEVGVDGSSDAGPVSFHRFFPDRLAVHPGDTVVFRRTDNGEPHTVTLATEPLRLDNAPGDRFFRGGFGNPPRTDASMPCFLTDGVPPAEGCTPSQQEPVAFDGTHTWFNSGGLLGEDEFAVELSDDLPPGSYLFICLVHNRTMQTTIDVVAETEPADTVEDVQTRAQEAMTPEQDNAERLIGNPPALLEGTVAAAATRPPFVTWANTFTPEDTQIAAGGTVTWTIRGIHTISFNAPESARPFFQRAADGSVEENPEAATPQGDPGAWDGSGVLNSGMRSGLVPPDEFSVTFTTPGTYPYRCLVHFDMEGKVTVRE